MKRRFAELPSTYAVLLNYVLVFLFLSSLRTRHFEMTRKIHICIVCSISFIRTSFYLFLDKAATSKYLTLLGIFDIFKNFALWYSNQEASPLTTPVSSGTEDGVLFIMRESMARIIQKILFFANPRTSNPPYRVIGWQGNIQNCWSPNWMKKFLQVEVDQGVQKDQVSRVRTQPATYGVIEVNLSAMVETLHRTETAKYIQFRGERHRVEHFTRCMSPAPPKRISRTKSIS